MWPHSDYALIARADEAIEDPQPVTIDLLGTNFQLSADGCALIGEDVFRTDPVEALLGFGDGEARNINNGKAQRAIDLAIHEGGETVEKMRHRDQGAV